MGTVVSVAASLVAIAIAWGRRGKAAEMQEKQLEEIKESMKEALREQRDEFRTGIEEVRLEHKAFVASTGSTIAAMSNSLNMLSAALMGFGSPGTGALAKLDQVSRRVHRLSSLVTALLMHSGVDVKKDDEEDDG